MSQSYLWSSTRTDTQTDTQTNRQTSMQSLACDNEYKRWCRFEDGDAFTNTFTPIIIPIITNSPHFTWVPSLSSTKTFIIPIIGVCYMYSFLNYQHKVTLYNYKGSFVICFCILVHPTNTNNIFRYVLCPYVCIYLAQGLYSLTRRTSYGTISWSLKSARFGYILFRSHWNLTGTSAAALPTCLSYFIALRSLWHPISRLEGFTRFNGKTSYRLVNRGQYSWVNGI